AAAFHPHQLDRQASLVDPAGWEVAAILIESDAAVFRDPTRRLRVTPGVRGPCHSTLVDDQHAVADVPIIILAEDDPPFIPQTEGRAGRGRTGRGQAQDEGGEDGQASSHQSYLRNPLDEFRGEMFHAGLEKSR